MHDDEINEKERLEAEINHHWGKIKSLSLEQENDNQIEEEVSQIKRKLLALELYNMAVEKEELKKERGFKS